MWAYLSGPKELCQTSTVWTEIIEGSQLSCLCGHWVPSELVQEDSSWGMLNWTRLLLFLRQAAQHFSVFLSQVIPAEAENPAELLLSHSKVPRKKCLWKR